MQSSSQMAKAMKGVTKVMGRMNQKMNLPQIQKIMTEFEKQNEMMGMKEEMMADAMDDAFADDEDEDEEENILGSVLAELGVEGGNKMASAGSDPIGQSGQTPGAAVPQAAADGGDPGGGGDAGGGGGDLDSDLQRRLDNLRR